MWTQGNHMSVRQPHQKQSKFSQAVLMQQASDRINSQPACASHHILLLCGSSGRPGIHIMLTWAWHPLRWWLSGGGAKRPLRALLQAVVPAAGLHGSLWGEEL